MEDWRDALDNRQYAAAIMMDLAKAFDCLPHVWPADWEAASLRTIREGVCPRKQLSE